MRSEGRGIKIIHPPPSPVCVSALTSTWAALTSASVAPHPRPGPSSSPGCLGLSRGARDQKAGITLASLATHTEDHRDRHVCRGTPINEACPCLTRVQPPCSPSPQPFLNREAVTGAFYELLEGAAVTHSTSRHSRCTMMTDSESAL